ncbi:hypothetical protein C8T65DRAFT_740693 [Cerioporus squamosus]|nr:hypothetical protein C8T65DRAFT_740693 [Cerioporus squamosus]
MNIRHAKETVNVCRGLPAHNILRFILIDVLEPSFYDISAYVRLGHKYQIDELLKQALDFLKRHFTTDFDTWYAHELYVPEKWDDVHAIGVVNITHLVGCDSLLPSALSVCCMLDGKDLVGGFVREDGTRERLSEQDLTLYITAISTLCQASTGVVLAVFVPFSREKAQSMESGTSEARVEPTAQAQASSDSLDLRKDEEFWMDDGTIILIARGVGFRVYWGVLSSHSPVFAEMFSLPQPAQSPSPSSLIPTPHRRALLFMWMIAPRIFGAF